MRAGSAGSTAGVLGVDGENAVALGGAGGGDAGVDALDVVARLVADVAGVVVVGGAAALRQSGGDPRVRRLHRTAAHGTPGGQAPPPFLVHLDTPTGPDCGTGRADSRFSLVAPLGVAMASPRGRGLGVEGRGPIRGRPSGLPFFFKEILLHFVGFYWVLLGFIGYSWVSLALPSFFWIRSV